MFSRLLKEHKILALDTAPFIYHFEENDRYLPATSFLFQGLQQNKIHAVTTVISLSEILVRPFQSESYNIAEDYKIVLNNFPNLTIVGINQNIAFLAAELRAKYSIKLPDALQIAGGLLNNATLFITNDKSLKKIKTIKIALLDELI